MTPTDADNARTCELLSALITSLRAWRQAVMVADVPAGITAASAVWELLEAWDAHQVEIQRRGATIQ